MIILAEAIKQAGDLYHRLVLLVGPQGVGKTAVLRSIAEAQDDPIINVNHRLCKAMLELTRSQARFRAG